MNFFGYSITKRKPQTESERESIQTFADESNYDGATDLTSQSSGLISHGVSFDNTPINESDMILKYRDLANQAEIEKAIDDIINEAFAYEEKNMPVEINLDDCENISEKVKETIRKEFDYILQLLNFKNDCYEIFRRWYVDGRLYYHKVIDAKNPKKGIKELKNINALKIKKVREETNKKSKKFVNFTEINRKYHEYYIYNPQGINHQMPEGLKIAPGTITYVHSGIFDKTNTVVLSHLHDAIKPYNQLRQIEDSTIIYRMTRAPEKRVFNVEISSLPPAKADQYMASLINKFTKRLKYDPTTGELQDQRRFSSIIEDWWFPKRDGKGTTVDVVQGGQLSNQTEEVEYFKKKLYEALKVPVSRLDGGQNFNLGRASEITRDELKFGKFISRLRKRFSYLFENILGDQLVMKGILTIKEWEIAKTQISFDYLEDNFFTEFKWNEIWNQRIATFSQMNEVIGTYLSRNWVRKNILRISEEEWVELQKELEQERQEQEALDKASGDAEEKAKEEAGKKTLEITSDSDIKINPDKKDIEDE